MLHGLEVGVVHPEMLHQGVVIGEGLVAGVADVLLGAMLHVHVTVQLGVGEESFVAELAVPGVLVEVAPLVDGQLEGLHKRVTANVANEISLVGVDPLVNGQSVGPLEGLPADVALIRTRVAVRHQVTLVKVLRSEKLGTHFTLIKRLCCGQFGKRGIHLPED